MTETRYYDVGFSSCGIMLVFKKMDARAIWILELWIGMLNL